jgi:fluoroquinolone resistance protein
MTIEELHHAIAKGAPIEDADLSHLEWKDLACAGAKFVRCRFIGCRLAHVDFRGAIFEDCIFTDKSALRGSAFAFTNLRETRLLRCDLSFCLIDRCKLFAIEMDRCNLLGARFNNVDFSQSFSRKLMQTRAAFRRCNLDVTNLAAIRLPQCDLSGSSLREADLTGADLTGANLQACDLQECDLTSANLTDADLRRARIAGLNILTLASVQGLKVSAEQQWLLLAGMGIEVHPD